MTGKPNKGGPKRRLAPTAPRAAKLIYHLAEEYGISTHRLAQAVGYDRYRFNTLFTDKGQTKHHMVDDVLDYFGYELALKKKR